MQHKREKVGNIIMNSLCLIYCFHDTNAFSIHRNIEFRHHPAPTEKKRTIQSCAIAFLLVEFHRIRWVHNCETFTALNAIITQFWLHSGGGHKTWLKKNLQILQTFKVLVWQSSFLAETWIGIETMSLGGNKVCFHHLLRLSAFSISCYFMMMMMLNLGVEPRRNEHSSPTLDRDAQNLTFYVSYVRLPNKSPLSAGSANYVFLAHNCIFVTALKCKNHLTLFLCIWNCVLCVSVWAETSTKIFYLH